ncbi:MAG: sigma-54-dependent Fis family transcriptional regulator [Blastocatellia bacterium]|nr:sigma-54-dependent Fis family transcriptional regulator [Blastocatellia bacterium]
MSKSRILVIDDDTNVQDLTKYHLSRHGLEADTAGSGEEGLNLLAERHFEVALIDLKLPDVDGIELVGRIKEMWPEIEIIVVTGYSSVTKAVEATKAGAFYFVEKPVNYDELMLLIGKALERREQTSEIRHLRGKLSDRTSYYNIIGKSKAMQNIYEIIESVAQSDANVLIMGESGTGKELVANAVHYKSLRGRKPFVKINCAALPKELIESELFGHTKGAFTGASKDKQGLIGQANGGSLLMDEIGEMPLGLQPKLLRVLQERVYLPLGSDKPQEVDFRLICATNLNPLEAMRNGMLREDLYYRINTIEIHVPPLREREEDVEYLVQHFLRVFAEKYNRPVQNVSQEAYEKLFAYSWPGNVRELQNVIERAVLMTKGTAIEANTLPLSKISRPLPEAPNLIQPQPSPPIPPASETPPGDLNFDELCRLLVSQLSPPSGEDDAQNIFERLEGSIVQAALERTRGNKQAAANLLGLYRPRLYSIIKKHNLSDVTG